MDAFESLKTWDDSQICYLSFMSWILGTWLKISFYCFSKQNKAFPNLKNACLVLCVLDQEIALYVRSWNML